MGRSAAAVDVFGRMEVGAVVVHRAPPWLGFAESVRRAMGPPATCCGELDGFDLCIARVSSAVRAVYGRSPCSGLK
ncbi:unnamed protein product [Penicillium discolor]